MNELHFKCNTKDCNFFWFYNGVRGLEKIGSSYRFPVVVASWSQKVRCPQCGKEYIYSDHDVRDAQGQPV